jgi:hypothetical protein
VTERPSFKDWDESYRENPVEEMPWFYEALDPDLSVALDKLTRPLHRVLDVPMATRHEREHEPLAATVLSKRHRALSTHPGGAESSSASTERATAQGAGISYAQ